MSPALLPAGRRWSVALLLALAAPSAAADAAVATGSVSGFVRDAADGEGLIGATVLLAGVPYGAVTNDRGYYVIPRVPAGPYRLACSYIGYREEGRAIAVAAGADLRVDLRLQAQSIVAREVVVRADSMRTVDRLFRAPISEVRLSAAQVEAVPQVAEADLLRTLQTLPGVLPLSDFSSALYVRGGTPDQNLYLIDGSDVYNPEHTFGIFSTFNTDAIKQVELSKGGFGAQYGGRLSSVLDVTNLDGNREEFEGTASVSLLSAKATLQAPLGRAGSLSGSIRRTWFDQTVGRALEDIPDYWFYDGNLKAFVELSDRDQLTLSYYGGRDFLDVVFNPEATEEAGIGIDWGNKTGSLRWTRVLAPRLFGTFWVTGSRFTSDFTLPIVDLVERNLVTDVTAKGHVEHHHADWLVTRFGFELKRLHVGYTQDFPEGLVDIQHEPRQAVLFATSSWRPTVRWDLEAGLRAVQFAADRTFRDLEPRLAVKYRLSDISVLRASTGLYHQYLHRVPRFAFTDIWVASNREQDASRAVHGVVGYQREVARHYQLEVEGYWKDFADIYQFNQTFLTQLEESGHDADGDPVFANTRGIFDRGDGRSAGLELSLRKDSGAVTGWLAWSLAQTVHRFDGINRDRPFAPRHDRTQVANLVATLDLRNAWRKLRGQTKHPDRGTWALGVSGVYGTGQPITDPGSAYVTRSSPAQPDLMVRYAPTVIDGARLPAYARLDLSLTWKREFGRWSMAPYLQLFNAGNRRNVWFVDYDFDGTLPDVSAVHMFPLLPTAGATFTF